MFNKHCEFNSNSLDNYVYSKREKKNKQMQTTKLNNQNRFNQYGFLFIERFALTE